MSRPFNRGPLLNDRGRAAVAWLVTATIYAAVFLLALTGG